MAYIGDFASNHLNQFSRRILSESVHIRWKSTIWERSSVEPAMERVPIAIFTTLFLLSCCVFISDYLKLQYHHVLGIKHGIIFFDPFLFDILSRSFPFHFNNFDWHRSCIWNVHVNNSPYFCNFRRICSCFILLVMYYFPDVSVLSGKRKLQFYIKIISQFLCSWNSYIFPRNIIC